MLFCRTAGHSVSTLNNSLNNWNLILAMMYALFHCTVPMNASVSGHKGWQCPPLPTMPTMPTCPGHPIWGNLRGWLAQVKWPCLKYNDDDKERTVSNSRACDHIVWELTCSDGEIGILNRTFFSGPLFPIFWPAKKSKLASLWKGLI